MTYFRGFLIAFLFTFSLMPSNAELPLEIRFQLPDSTSHHDDFMVVVHLFNPTNEELMVVGEEQYLDFILTDKNKQPIDPYQSYMHTAIYKWEIILPPQGRDSIIFGFDNSYPLDETRMHVEVTLYRDTAEVFKRYSNPVYVKPIVDKDCYLAVMDFRSSVEYLPIEEAIEKLLAFIPGQSFCGAFFNFFRERWNTITFFGALNVELSSKMIDQALKYGLIPKEEEVSYRATLAYQIRIRKSHNIAVGYLKKYLPNQYQEIVKSFPNY